MYCSFKDNIWGVNLADMQLTSKYNKGIRYLLCAIDLFSKYTFVVPLKDRKGSTIVNVFLIILNKAVNFTILVSKNDWKTITWKCIQHITLTVCCC